MPPSFSFPASGGTQNATVNGRADCSWLVTDNRGWATPPRVFGGAQIQVTVPPHTGDAHSVTVSIGALAVEVLQAPWDPFYSLCPLEWRLRVPPVAHAGFSSQAAWPGTPFQLNGSGSYDPLECPLRYHWTRLHGPNVTLTGPSGPRPTFQVPEDAPDGTQWVFNLNVAHADNSPLNTDARVTVTVRVPGPDLSASRTTLLIDYASRKPHLPSACAAWTSLPASAQDVFIWNTHRLYITGMLSSVEKLYAVYGQKTPDNCGDLGYNRTYMGASPTLSQQMRNTWHATGPQLPDWKQTGDL